MTKKTNPKAKPASEKRTPLPLTSGYGSSFKRDWDRLSASGRYDMNLLSEVMTLIILNKGPLPPKYKDHPLKGDWTGHRDCHVRDDFLLIYKVDGSSVIFVRTGTHAELFR